MYLTRRHKADNCITEGNSPLREYRTRPIFPNLITVTEASMLNSLTTSAHNSLPSSQVSRLLTGALLLAAAGLTGCDADAVSHSDSPSFDLHTAGPASTARTFVPTHHHANSRDLSRVELSPRQLAAVHTL
jgi:hypothetical protein